MINSRAFSGRARPQGPGDEDGLTLGTRLPPSQDLYGIAKFLIAGPRFCAAFFQYGGQHMEFQDLAAGK